MLKLNVEKYSRSQKIKFITQIIQNNIFKNLLGIIVTFISFYLSIYISLVFNPFASEIFKDSHLFPRNFPKFAYFDMLAQSNNSAC